MVEEKYGMFLMKILQMTKEERISWDYLDQNESLYSGMNWIRTSTRFGIFGEKETVSPNFDREDSFYAKIGETSIVILVKNNQPATLYVVPNTYKKVVRFDADEYGELITRLRNLVQSKFPSGEVFIDELLNRQD